jgi:hypothetical protein
MIIQNAVYIRKLGKYFKSAHVHDFVSFEVDGKTGFIDGGNDYFRAGGIATKQGEVAGIVIDNYRLDENSSILDVFEKLLWGTRGKDGKQPLTYKRIKDLELDHLKAIKNLALDLNETKEIKYSPLHLFVINYWIGEKIEEIRKQADKDFIKNIK